MVGEYGTLCVRAVAVAGEVSDGEACAVRARGLTALKVELVSFELGFHLAIAGAVVKIANRSLTFVIEADKHPR